MSTTTRTAIDEPAAPYVNIDGYARHKVVGQRYSSTGKIATNSWRQDQRHECYQHEGWENATHRHISPLSNLRLKERNSVVSSMPML